MTCPLCDGERQDVRVINGREVVVSCPNCGEDCRDPYDDVLDHADAANDAEACRD